MENRITISVPIYDPGQDSYVPILRVPTGHVYSIEAAYACADRAHGASTADYYMINLLNGGTAGTATTAISGTAGGTAGWAANTPKAMTPISGSGDLTAGQWLVASYQETGTAAPGIVTLSIELVDGIGAYA